MRATPYQQRPVRMAYALTAEARDLASALRLLADWGARRTGGAEPIRHELCGTPLEAHWYCQTCSVVVDEAHASETRLGIRFRSPRANHPASDSESDFGRRGGVVCGSIRAPSVHSPRDG